MLDKYHLKFIKPFQRAKSEILYLQVRKMSVKEVKLLAHPCRTKIQAWILSLLMWEAAACLAISLQRFYKYVWVKQHLGLAFTQSCFQVCLLDLLMSPWLPDVSMASQSTEGPSSHPPSIPIYMLSSQASIPALNWLYQSSCFQLGKVIRHSPEMLASWTEIGIRCSIFKIGPETELFAVPGWNPGTEPSRLPFESRHQREKQASHWHICAVLRISVKDVTLLSFPLQK